jgi:hypothetical protein
MRRPDDSLPMHATKVAWEADVRDPQAQFEHQNLPCMDLTIDPVQVLEWFVL